MSWQKHLEQIRDVRHWLHQHPELTWQEAGTALFVRQKLTE